MAGAADIVAILLLAFAATAASWLYQHPRWGTQPEDDGSHRGHVHWLKEWDDQ